MIHYFLDSSALIKRYVTEPGTAWIRSISSPSIGNTIVVALITEVEVFSGVSRRKREGSISLRNAKAILLLMRRQIKREFVVVDLTAPIIQLSEDLLDKYSLRASDSIQLASALFASNQFVATGLDPIIFVSADTRLLTAASTEGLTVNNANAYP